MTAAQNSEFKTPVHVGAFVCCHTETDAQIMYYFFCFLAWRHGLIASSCMAWLHGMVAWRGCMGWCMAILRLPLHEA